MRLERARVGTSELQGLTTIGTGRLLSGSCRGPVSGDTGQGHILKHARPNAHPAVIKLLFHLAERGFGVR